MREQAAPLHEHEPLLLHHVRDITAPYRTHLLIGPEPVGRRDRLRVGERLSLPAVPARPVARGALISGMPDRGSFARLLALDGTTSMRRLLAAARWKGVAGVRGDDLVAGPLSHLTNSSAHSRYDLVEHATVASASTL